MVQWELQLQHITTHWNPDRKSLGFAAHCTHCTQPAQCSPKGNLLGSGSKTQTTGKASRTESPCKTTEKNIEQRNMGCSLWTQSCGLSMVIAALFRGTGEGREKHTRLKRETRQKQQQRSKSRACQGKWKLNMKNNRPFLQKIWEN